MVHALPQWKHRIEMHSARCSSISSHLVMVSWILQELCPNVFSMLSARKVGFNTWPTLEDCSLFLWIFGYSVALFGVRRGFEMILSHRVPSSLNMSSCRAIWTHFRPNLIILINFIFNNYISELQISRQMDAQPSGRRKT